MSTTPATPAPGNDQSLHPASPSVAAALSGQLDPPAPAGAPPAPPAAPSASASTDTQAVPYERFREVNESLKAEREQREALERWKAEQERAAMTEQERITAERDEALTRAQQAEDRVVKLERGQLAAAAARRANFADPDDAAAFIDLATIEDQATADAAVAQLAERKPHLLRTETTAPTTPTAIGGLTSPAPGGEPPVGQDGKPDVRLGLGRDLLASLTGPKR